ncbi:MAG TPA: ShlB/FhaC/HecB family hemolysin secretion/activation protein, partial [Nevskiaceae bacterium]|nr:ShlB/FhaC/HecB family hemolysin secretion/activation protein [Nevskiaceae bacterium]
ARHTADAEPTALRVELSNPGNRFVGRSFLDLDITGSSAWGDEVHLLWREGLNGLNGAGNDSRYHEPSIAWNRVTNYGVIGAGIHYTNFDFVFNGIPLHGDLRQVEALWLYPLYADFTHHWLFELKGDRTDKKNETEADIGTPGTAGFIAAGTKEQEEVYTSVEVTNTWSQKLHLLKDDSSFDAALTVRRGLSSEHQPVTPANLDYLLYRPALALKQPFGERFNVSASINGQFSTDVLPEQQEWLLGGLGSMTAYLPGVAIGDVGYSARAQAEFNLDVAHFELVPRAFFEYGYATFQNPSAGETSQRQTLSDVGAELAFKWGKLFEGSVAWAAPVDHSGIAQSELDAQRANVYFRIAAKL